MKRTTLICLIAVFAVGSLVLASETMNQSKTMAKKSEDTGLNQIPDKWIAIEGKVLTGKPWKAAPDGAVFKSSDGTFLKATAFKATYLLDLKNKKVFKMGDGDKKTELTVERMFQRYAGKKIIARCTDFRIRLDLVEKYEAAGKLLGGLKQQ